MNDTEILNWIETHIYGLHQLLDSSYRIYWHDDNGFENETEGKSLRDCVIKARES